MTVDSRVSLRTGTAVLLGLVLLLTGAAASFVLLRTPATAPEDAAMTASGPEGVPAGVAGANLASDEPASGEVAVTLTDEAVERAGIVVQAVGMAPGGSEFRLPGIVEANGYRQVAVTPLAAGRVTRVAAELGAPVRRGQTLAEIFSPELTEAATRYVAATAMLDAHDRELRRTERLVEIGAASRQELERVHAEHAGQEAAVQSARSQLELLGMTGAAIDKAGAGGTLEPIVRVPAPIDGVVTERFANAGLNVDAATKLFTVVDLSTVWVVADVFEGDFSRVRVGSDAKVTTSAYPELIQTGRISYIDPNVNPGTRTAKVRVEVPNPRGVLRLGMYAEVLISAPGGEPVPHIPRSAVQNVGDRTVVYLADPARPGRFVERQVQLGPAMGQDVAVLSGLQAGDRLVTKGSFSLRAERERLGSGTIGAPAHDHGPLPVDGAAAEGTNTSVQTWKVVVTGSGFEPSTISVRVGTPVRITFLRTTDQTCATEIVFPSLNIRRALPLNEPATIEFTPDTTGTIAFACGMNMLRGAIVAS
jgi:RND family efflux transporter MFP subunit